MKSAKLLNRPKNKSVPETISVLPEAVIIQFFYHVNCNDMQKGYKCDAFKC